MRAALRLAGLTDGRAAAVAIKCRSAIAAASITALQTMPASSLPGPDGVELDLMARSLASHTASLSAVSSFTDTELSQVQQVARRLREQVARCSRPAAPPQLVLPTAAAVAPGGESAFSVQAGGLNELANFGAFRCDFDVETLAGVAGSGKILRPVDLAAVAAPVASLTDAVRALRTCVHACTLLANQANQIRNSYCLRVSLIAHLFTQVLPLPLPPASADAGAGGGWGPGGGARCFWAGQRMHHETQVEILQDVRLLARHLATACLSLRTSRELDATRLVAFAAMVTLADAVLRIAADDFPSPVSLHYNGTAPGPTTPFAIDIGDFAAESETVMLRDPYLAVARTQTLDYLEQQRAAVADDHVVMNLHLSNAASTGDAVFIDQLCVQMGFLREGNSSERAAEYISGSTSEIVDHYPELAAFRDIVFLLKLFMVPSLDLLPPLKSWRMRDSMLTWSSQSTMTGGGLLGGGISVGTYCVTGFGNFELSPHKRPPPKSDGVLQGFIGYFKGGAKPRAPLSGANPSFVAGGEVVREDDVLHMSSLPNFSHTLPPSDSERLIQMLTVPYLRIPLVLAFLADESRLSALEDKDLQNVVDSCLFEPGSWQASAPTEPPAMVPDLSRASLSTPCGLLVNELVNSPAGILESVLKMLDVVMDMDTGSFYGPSTAVILYVLRMATRVCQYAAFVVRNFQWRAAAASGTSAATAAPAFRSYVRGLCPPAHRQEVVSELQKLKNRLEGKLLVKGWAMLETWRLKLLKASPPAVLEASVVLTHQSYLFCDGEFVSKHLAVDSQERLGSERALEENLSAKAVETLVTCQIFLSHNYSFDMEGGYSPDHGGKKKNKKIVRGKGGIEIDTSLQVSQLEVFDLYSRHRARLIRWVHGGGSLEAGGLGAMDSVAKTPDQLLEHVILSLTSARYAHAHVCSCLPHARVCEARHAVLRANLCCHLPCASCASMYLWSCLSSCIHLCIYVSMYLCIYVSMYLCIDQTSSDTHMHARTHARAHTRIHTHTHTHTHAHTHTLSCARKYAHAQEHGLELERQ